jgi:hypothetical protein
MTGRLLVWALVLAFGLAARAQDAKQIVQQAMKTELAANRDDHTRWQYFEVDRKPKNAVTQWVAETQTGDLHRVLEEDGHKLSHEQQKKKMDDFMGDAGAKSQQQKGEEQDDRQATELLKLLPEAFVWTITGTDRGTTILHFKPDPNFRPPNREAKVFSAMEGDMKVDIAQHRIVSLKGKLIHEVKFGGGILGSLRAGGSFDVERREIGKSEWQITETHVHIQGRALLFKSISEQEDDVKSKFEQLSGNTTLQDAEAKLLHQSE